MGLESGTAGTAAEQADVDCKAVASQVPQKRYRGVTKHRRSGRSVSLVLLRVWMACSHACKHIQNFTRRKVYFGRRCRLEHAVYGRMILEKLERISCASSNDTELETDDSNRQCVTGGFVMQMGSTYLGARVGEAGVSGWL